MNETEAAFVILELGYTNVLMGDGIVRADCQSCMKGGRTFRVMLNGKHPGFYCHRCHDSGPLLGLVWRRIVSDGRPYTKALYVVNEAIANAEEAETKVSRLDYQPFGDRPTVKRSAKPVDHIPVTGVQLDLGGRAVSSEKAPPFTEDQIQRYPKKYPLYMLDRGFTRETMDKFDVRINAQDRRVVFPIRDWDGAPKAVSQRLVWNEDHCMRCNSSILNDDGSRMYRCKNCGKMYSKYLHSKGFRRNDVLYGEWLIQDESHDGIEFVVIVEGMTDVMRVWQLGMRPENGFLPLAVMGAYPGESQIRRILSRAPWASIVVMKDWDDPSKYPDLPPGMAPGDVMVEKVREYATMIRRESRVMEITPREMGMDPGDYSEADVKIAMEAAVEWQDSGEHTGKFSIAESVVQ